MTAPSLLRLFLPFVALALLCPALPAAPTVEPAPRTFRIFTVVTAITDLKYDPAPAKPVPLLISQNPGSPYPIPRDNRVSLYKEIPPPPSAPPGTPPKKVIIAEAVVPADAPRVLIAVIPDETGRLSTHVIPDDPALHPVGRLRFINLSRFQAALALNKDKHLLEPGKATLLGWPKTGGILVQVAAQKDGTWESVLRRERRARTTARTYCIVFDYAPDPEQYLTDPSNPPPATVRFFFENAPAAP